MKKMQDKSALLISAQRALLFSITPTMRFISIAINQDNVLLVLIHAENEFADDEFDLIYTAAGQICGDFEELTDSEVTVKIDNSPYENLTMLSHLVFAKAEV